MSVTVGRGSSVAKDRKKTARERERDAETDRQAGIGRQTDRDRERDKTDCGKCEIDNTVANSHTMAG